MYRVETFIIPANNQCNTEISINETNNLKVASQLTIQNVTESQEILKSNTEDCIEKEKVDISELRDLYYEEYDSSLTQSTDEEKEKNIKLNNSIVNIFDHSNDRLTDCCYHGYKNGCTVLAPTPEKISEEVFKQNWLKKLETLRQREAMLNDKEIALQCRERLLSKKEKELQILEKLVQNKIKQAQLYIKHSVNSHNINGNVEEEKTSESRSSSSSKDSEKKKMQRKSSIKGFTEKEKCRGLKSKHINPDKKFTEEDQYDKQETYEHIVSGKETQISENSGTFAASLSSQLLTGISKNQKQFSYSNTKFKTRPKKSYDDLDSTLSADPGDASFVRTSKIFNPEAYRKPFVFAHAITEQHVSHTNTKELTTLCTIKEVIQNSDGIEEGKVIKRITENISATQDKTTKFQDYGLIDQQNSNVHSNKSKNSCTVYDDKRYSYLNLETGWKNHEFKSGRILKDRPVSWNKETDNWLQKKRQAYNQSIRRSQVKNCEDKENIKFTVTVDTTEKSVKKKNIRSKMFNIFR